MGIREIINRNQSLTIVAAGILVLGAGWMVVGQARAIFSPPLFDEAYYSTDDGKTWFLDKKMKMPPFETGQGTAVGAEVYREAGKEYVAFLHRYTAETKSAIEAYERDKAANVQPKRMDLVMGADISGKEVKKPGSPNWVSFTSPEGRVITTAVARDGGTAEKVEP